MKKKMGRPKLPKGESKDVQIGVRFKAREIDMVEKCASQEQTDKVRWLRQKSLEATQEWINCKPWLVENLHGKSVAFKLVTILEGPIVGKGKFDAWKRGDGLVKIRIITHPEESTTYASEELRVYIPQRGVQFIKKLPPGSATDFSVIDPAFDKYVRAGA